MPSVAPEFNETSNQNVQHRRLPRRYTLGCLKTTDSCKQTFERRWATRPLHHHREQHSANMWRSGKTINYCCPCMTITKIRYYALSKFTSPSSYSSSATIYHYILFARAMYALTLKYDHSKLMIAKFHLSVHSGVCNGSNLRQGYAWRQRHSVIEDQI